ncbi:hypothetical protein KR51_00010840 [Rubidibacter lacunae KORDI 51-2]|uniref:Uncharacterized protein n=1 Tax=Rubidibacter lacunae KORDI 51-2 TaxID=582515 RepID=U5DR45_9CHRO|nr:hypothetical protein KR51_00010840 [Rubidibacter lacunae KORDI 51-2]
MKREWQSLWYRFIPQLLSGGWFGAQQTGFIGIAHGSEETKSDFQRGGGLSKPSYCFQGIAKFKA